MKGGTGNTRWSAKARQLITKPPFDVKIVKQGSNFGTDDIVKTIKFCVKEYNKIRSLKAFAPSLDYGTNERTLQAVYDFWKGEIEYKKDDAGFQDVIQPDSVFWQGFADCKGMSISVFATLSELGIPCKFRFARYTPTMPNGRVTHIYTIAYLNGKEYVMDTVNTGFNKEVKPYYFEDLTITAYPSVSGLPSVGDYTGILLGGLGGAFVGRSIFSTVTGVLLGDLVSMKTKDKSVIFKPLINKLNSLKFF